MIGLSESERISMIRSAVLTQYTRVTDRRTDGRTELAWHIRAVAYMLSRVKNATINNAHENFTLQNVGHNLVTCCDNVT